MSNRRKLRPQHPASARIAALDGAKIPGGCDSCDAYMAVAAHAYGGDVHAVTIRHDDNCPRLAAMKARK